MSNGETSTAAKARAFAEAAHYIGGHGGGSFPKGKALEWINKLADDLDQTLSPETLGWAHAYFCKALDEGRDPREIEVPEFLEAAQKDFKRIDR